MVGRSKQLAHPDAGANVRSCGPCLLGQGNDGGGRIDAPSVVVQPAARDRRSKERFDRGQVGPREVLGVVALADHEAAVAHPVEEERMTRSLVKLFVELDAPSSDCCHFRRVRPDDQALVSPRSVRGQTVSFQQIHADAGSGEGPRGGDADHASTDDNDIRATGHGCPVTAARSRESKVRGDHDVDRAWAPNITGDGDG